MAIRSKKWNFFMRNSIYKYKAVIFSASGFRAANRLMGIQARKYR